MMSYCCVNKHPKFYAEFKIQVEERWRLIFEITDHIITTGPGDNIMMTRSVLMNKEFCSAGFGPSFDNGGEVNQVTFGSFPGIIVSSNRCVLAIQTSNLFFMKQSLRAHRYLYAIGLLGPEAEIGPWRLRQANCGFSAHIPGNTLALSQDS